MKNFFYKLLFLIIAGIVLTSALFVNTKNNTSNNLPKFMLWSGENTLNDSMKNEEMETYLQKLYDHNIKGVFLNTNNEFFKRISPFAIKVGVQIHAWRPSMVKFDQEFMKQHRSWYAVNRNGISCVDEPPYVGYYRWLCPTDTNVYNYLLDDYLTLAKIDGIAGIHFDYIRYCDIYLPSGLLPKYNLVQDHEMPEYDFCYCNRCRVLFKSQHGRDPIEIGDPANDVEWKKWRLEQIVHLVNGISQEVKTQTNKIVTAAVFPTPQMSIDMVRQDWGNFKIDAVVPMLYNGFYKEDINWIGQCVNEGIKTMEIKKDLLAGLFLPDLKEPAKLVEAINIAKINGAKGVVLFSANNINNNQLIAIKNFTF